LIFAFAICFSIGLFSEPQRKQVSLAFLYENMAMFRSRYSLLILTAVLFISGCHSEIDFIEGSFRPGQAEVVLNGSTLSMNFPESNGSASIELEATGKWTASFVNDRAKDWCSLSAESGNRGKATITISVKENKDYEQRSASINFICGDDKHTIVVTQKQKDALLVSSNRMDVDNNGGTIIIEVKTTVDFTYTISDNAKSWITPSGTKGLMTSQLLFKVEANEELEKREGAITINSSAGSETVRIFQYGATPTLIASSSQIEIPSSETTFQVEVRSNVDVSIAIPDSCNWIREIKTKAMSTNTYFFEVDENDMSSEREGIVLFENKDLSLIEAVHILQGTGTILISSAQIEVPGIGGDILLFVSGHNPTHYRLESDADWITIQDAEDSEIGLCYRCSVEGQTSKQQRTAKIAIHYSLNDLPGEAVITQHVPCPAVTYTSNVKQAISPFMLEDSQNALIYWGDGICQPYAKGLTHNYPANGLYTITVTSDPITALRVGNLQNEVYFDFSHITTE